MAVGNKVSMLLHNIEYVSQSDATVERHNRQRTSTTTMGWSVRGGEACRYLRTPVGGQLNCLHHVPPRASHLFTSCRSCRKLPHVSSSSSSLLRLLPVSILGYLTPGPPLRPCSPPASHPRIGVVVQPTITFAYYLCKCTFELYVLAG